MHKSFIQLILYILYMQEKTTIAISRDSLLLLHEAKFDFRVNTLEETVRKLLNEHGRARETKI